MSPTPGILYVTMQPHPSLPSSQFHDWYNNEHGPTRLRLPFFTNGFRYRAADISPENGASDSNPEWMAIYDVTDMHELTQPTYMSLRSPPAKSQREIETMAQITVDRKMYDLLDSKESPNFQGLEDVQHEGKPETGNVIIAVTMRLKPGVSRSVLDKWYTEEHTPLLSKIPGWLRTRRFVTAAIDGRKDDDDSANEYFALHEFAPQNGLGTSEELKVATSTKWYQEIMTEKLSEGRRRMYGLYYTFGAAPRDLASLESPDSKPFTSGDKRTTTFPAQISSSSTSKPTSSESTSTGPAIGSFVTTPDGAILPFRLEGSTSPNAPLIVLSNSILVSHEIWDLFLTSFFSHTPNKKYRILRYNTRGRTDSSIANSSEPITVDLLAQDIISLLDALRVPQAAAVIGVSLGGATALRVGMSFPGRVACFVACDTNAKAPPTNRKAWGERIEMAEKDAASSTSSTSPSSSSFSEKDGKSRIVGPSLAEATVRRWFTEQSYSTSEILPRIEAVKDMVHRNGLDGFRRSVEALYEYDFGAEMEAFEGRGAFVVGEGDWALPKGMQEMARRLGMKGAMGMGGKAPLKVVPGAGHLPMVERPEEVAGFVTECLEGRV
ncbi:hypothetical protein MMC25_003488 [Agyrium rufum]|nr:hypothetical protein [Agyrium rufum]